MIAHDAEERECCEKTHEARAEVERLKALLSRLVRRFDNEDDFSPVPELRDARAALDGSSPAPRMHTEEQVRAAWERSEDEDGVVLDVRTLLKALLESP